MAVEPKKSCCRSSPRCRTCPVLIARARRVARARPAGPASLFDEIYGGRADPLPESVTQALVALSLARDSRRHADRRRAAA